MRLYHSGRKGRLANRIAALQIYFDRLVNIGRLATDDELERLSETIQTSLETFEEHWVINYCRVS
jgi:hypothetical protein